MPSFELPLSGDVSQFLAPWSIFFNPSNSNFSLVNVNLGRSSAPEVEKQVLAEVGSYGKQLGRIGDALTVLMTHFKPNRDLTPQEDKALRKLKDMLEEIDDIKTSAGRETAPRS